MTNPLWWVCPLLRLSSCVFIESTWQSGLVLIDQSITECLGINIVLAHHFHGVDGKLLWCIDQHGHSIVKNRKPTSWLQCTAPTITEFRFITAIVLLQPTPFQPTTSNLDLPPLSSHFQHQSSMAAGSPVEGVNGLCHLFLRNVDCGSNGTFALETARQWLKWGEGGPGGSQLFSHIILFCAFAYILTHM
jgi:hypothetical protein